jgi:hypothetical protein
MARSRRVVDRARCRACTSGDALELKSGVALVSTRTPRGAVQQELAGRLPIAVVTKLMTGAGRHRSQSCARRADHDQPTDVDTEKGSRSRLRSAPR